MSNKIDVKDNEKENENDYDNEKLLNKLTIETKKPNINIYFISKTFFILFNFFIIFYKKSTELKEQNIQKIPAKENNFNKNYTNYTIENIIYGDNWVYNNVDVIISNAPTAFYDINYIIIKQAQITELEDRE